jgi:hypothetical protein
MGGMLGAAARCHAPQLRREGEHGGGGQQQPGDDLAEQVVWRDQQQGRAQRAADER